MQQDLAVPETSKCTNGNKESNRGSGNKHAERQEPELQRRTQAPDGTPSDATAATATTESRRQPRGPPPGSKAAERRRQTHGRLKNKNSERLSVPGEAATRQLESTAQSQPCPWSPHRPAFLEAFA